MNPTDTREIRGRAVHPNTDDMAFLADLGRVADDVRQIATDLGQRPYRVFLVTEESQGEELGIGETRITRIKEILPTPKVTSLDVLNRELTMGGIIEKGNITVSQISLVDFTEDDLLGVDPVTGDVPANLRQTWIVMETTDPRIADLQALIADLSAGDDQGSSQSAADGAAFPNVNAGRLPLNRAFIQKGAAFLNAGRASWEIVLEKIEPNLTRQGQYPQTGEAA